MLELCALCCCSIESVSFAAVAMSIAAVSQQLRGHGLFAVGNVTAPAPAALFAAACPFDMDGGSEQCTVDSTTLTHLELFASPSDVKRYKPSPSSSSSHYSTTVVSDGQHQLTDDNNYMLKSGRPRSSSLSLVPRLSSAPHSAPTRSHPPTPPPPAHHSASPRPLISSHLNHQHLHQQQQQQQQRLLASSSASTPALYGRLVCSCLPTCCCHCTLLSSIAECQGVYHQACARYVQQHTAVSCCPSSSATNGPVANVDASPPQTVPQDVVSRV